jgi:hypothetical protein
LRQIGLMYLGAGFLLWDGGGGYCVGDPLMFKFFRRFGGEVSFEQRLAGSRAEDAGWLQPVWQVWWMWFVAWLRELKVAAEMASVDQQAAEISEAGRRLRMRNGGRKLSV